jgi:hypothetical protein
MNGRSPSPITLTSFGSSGGNGRWAGIAFLSGSPGSLHYVHESWGGNSGNPLYPAGIAIDGASPTINSSTIDRSSGNDVEVVAGGLPVLHGDSFLAVPSGRHGVTNDGWSTGQPLADATNTWWGDTSGPYDPARNSSGKGTPVGSGVSYSPWLSSAPATGTTGGHPAGTTCPAPQAILKASALPYTHTGSDGITWKDMDPIRLSATLTPRSDVTANLSGMAALWTRNARSGVDLGIGVSGGSYGSGRLVARVSTGAIAASPGLTLVHGAAALKKGVTYTVRLAWKMDRADVGTIEAGVTPSNKAGTRLTLELTPTCAIRG